MALAIITFNFTVTTARESMRRKLACDAERKQRIPKKVPHELSLEVETLQMKQSLLSCILVEYWVCISEENSRHVIVPP
jgi:hypothetical protein